MESLLLSTTSLLIVLIGVFTFLAIAYLLIKNIIESRILRMLQVRDQYVSKLSNYLMHPRLKGEQELIAHAIDSTTESNMMVIHSIHHHEWGLIKLFQIKGLIHRTIYNLDKQVDAYDALITERHTQDKVQQMLMLNPKAGIRSN